MTRLWVVEEKGGDVCKGINQVGWSRVRRCTNQVLSSKKSPKVVDWSPEVGPSRMTQNELETRRSDLETKENFVQKASMMIDDVRKEFGGGR
ncbi:hypothetical protein U1Q18_007999 [Sarracenia purpurea var. burkii]